MATQENSFESASSDILEQQSIAASSLIQTMGALAFGAIILFVVGFSSMGVAHNAAHDTRHTLTFPCH